MPSEYPIDKDESKWEPVNPLIDGRSYVEAAIEYEKGANQVCRESGIIILTGNGVRVNVRHRGLCLHPGRTHVPQEVVDTTLWAGAHNTHGLVILSDDGYITFDAIEWCRNQNIGILMLDLEGNVVFTVGEIGSDVGLRRCQYLAEETGMAGYVAREVIKLKTLGQISVLKTIPSHPLVPGQVDIIGGRKVTIKRNEVVYGEHIWELHERRLEELGKMKDIDAIRALEANLAFKYWSSFAGIPIHWKAKDERIVPPHWKVITDRMGYLGSSARHALNPFQSALNYAYGMLEAQTLAAANVSGLDPICGVLHLDRPGRNSLVYDLMEPNRPLVDRLVLDLFDKTVFTRGMFVPLDSGEVRMASQFARYVAASCALPMDRVLEMVNHIANLYRRI